MNLSERLAIAMVLVMLVSLGFGAPPGDEPPGNMAEAVAALEDENAAQQEQIEANEEGIEAVEAALPDTYVLIDSDEPPKVLGEVTNAWWDTATTILEIDGYLTYISAYRNFLNVPSAYFDGLDCTGQAFYWNRSIVPEPIFDVIPMALPAGVVTLYSIGDFALTNIKSEYVRVYDTCYDFDRTLRVAPITVLNPLLNIEEMYPPPYEVIKQ